MSLAAAAGIDHGRGRATATEAPQGANFDLRILRRILELTRPYAARRNVIFALTLLRAIQKPAMAWAIAAVINGPIAGGDYPGVIRGALGFLALAVATELTFHFRQRMALELGESVVHDLRNAVFAHLQRMPMAFYHRTRLGRILSRVISDIEAVRRGVHNTFFFSLLLFGQMTGSAVLMLYYNPLLFGLLAAVGPLVWITNRHFHPRLARLSRAAAESQSRITGSLAESVKGMRVIQAFTRQPVQAERFSRLVGAHADDNVSLQRESALYVPLLDLNSQLFIATLILAGGYGALHGFAGLELGSLIAFLFLPNLFFQSLQHLANMYTQVVTALAGAERVFRMLDEKPDWEDAPDARDLPDPRLRRGPPDTAAGMRVEFRGVTFGYHPGRPVLHDINFVASAGRVTALVGPTGSGKSSILNLVAKFHLPDSGLVLLDGHDVRALRGPSIRSHLGIVLQSNFLFSGSVLDNIRLGRPGASDDEAVAAARDLDCLDLLEALPEGLATQVGERGGALSLGQRQLICFARALLARPRLLILDEATSSIDTITESRLQAALERLLHGRTSFVVAHRLSTIRRADQILVLEDGRIVQHGTHAELAGRQGHYRTLYRRFALQEKD